MITPNQIQTVLERVDLQQLVGERVDLKKKGSSYEGLCPFHDENRASFKVFSDHYHCFGCGAHGNAIEFTMQTTNAAFPEAVRSLASRAGVLIDEFSPVPDQNQELHHVLGLAIGEYQKHLMHAEGNPGLQELERRGIDSESIIRYGIGYAPAAWDTLLKNPQMRGAQRLLDAGLICPRGTGKGYYDRFRDRLMFPISDEKGRPVGFGGRRLGDGDKAGPKYLNSPETAVFHKGEALFGVAQALPFIRERGSVIVVEGYFDVVTPAQFGIENIVATAGTALTEENAAALLKLAKKIVFCFDGDKAGRAATWRATRLLLPLLTDEHALHLCLLPEAHDPDSYVRALGGGSFLSLTDQAPSLCEYLVGTIAEVPSTPEARARAVRLGVDVFKDMKRAHVLRQFFRNEFCRRMKISEATFNALVYPPDANGLVGCAHCGGKGSLDERRVFCLACGASGPRGKDDAEAIAGWNARH